MENQEQKIKMYTVHSSNVQKVGWYFCDFTNQGILLIEFKNGSMYQYFPVEKDALGEILKSKEPGKYLQENYIKNKAVNYQKVGQPKMNL